MYFHYHVVAHAKENHVDFNHDTNPVNDSLHSTETLGGGQARRLIATSAIYLYISSPILTKIMSILLGTTEQTELSLIIANRKCYNEV